MSKTTVAMLAAIAIILVCQANSIGIEEEKEGNTALRKLGFDFNVEKTFNIKAIEFMGQTLFFKYRIAVKDGKAINEIIIESNLGTFKFGNSGADTETNKMWFGKTKILTYKFPQMPSIIIGIYASGNLHYSVKYATASKDSLELSLSGDLKAEAEVISVSTDMTKIIAGASGNLISVSGTTTISKKDINKGFRFSATTVKTWVEGKVGLTTLFKKEFKICDSWNY